MNFFTQNKTLTTTFIVIIVSIVWMTYTETLSYPYIMTVRQIETIKFCLLEPKDFNTNQFGFRIKIPKEYCFLPNRIYPADSSMNIIKKGPYFVINEFAKGTISKATRANIQFEPLAPRRNVKDIMKILKDGGYLANASLSEMTNKNGVKIQIARGVSGIDPDIYYDWAFVDNPNGKIFLSILLFNRFDDSVFQYILDNLELV